MYSWYYTDKVYRVIEAKGSYCIGCLVTGIVAHRYDLKVERI